MRIRDAIIGEVRNPSVDTVRLIAKKVFKGVLNKKIYGFFEKLVKSEIRNVHENGFLEDEDIVTTPEELEGFHIVRAVVSEEVDSSRIAIRNRKSYCAVLFDDNHNYTICRMHFNDLDNLMISLFDSMERDKYGRRIGEKIRIDNVSDMYRFRDRLVETVRVYERVKK